jgi:hypothetical protein
VEYRFLAFFFDQFVEARDNFVPPNHYGLQVREVPQRSGFRDSRFLDSARYRPLQQQLQFIRAYQPIG